MSGMYLCIYAKQIERYLYNMKIDQWMLYSKSKHSRYLVASFLVVWHACKACGKSFNSARFLKSHAKKYKHYRSGNKSFESRGTMGTLSTRPRTPAYSDGKGFTYVMLHNAAS